MFAHCSRGLPGPLLQDNEGGQEFREQKIFRREEEHQGLAITVWGM